MASPATVRADRRVRVGRLSLAYYVWGAGDPILMIMGLGGRAADWGALPQRLARRWRVVTFDNRGTGASDKPDEEYSLETMATDAVAVLDAERIEAAHVVGVSMGGMIAQIVALQYARRVRRLVLLSTMAGGPLAVPPNAAAAAALQPLAESDPAAQIRRSLAAITAPGFAEQNPGVIEEMVRVILAQPTPPTVLLRQFQAVMDADHFDVLPWIRARTLVIHGECDSLVPPRNGEILAERIPGARLVRLPGCGHLAMWEQPERLGTVIEDFLAGG